MIDDFNDFHFVGALYCLRHLIVVHQNQFARDGFEEISFGENAHRLAVVAKHGEGQVTG